MTMATAPRIKTNHYLSHHIFYGLADADLFASKPVSIHWELMFTRSIYQTVDMAEQGVLLNEVARLVDAGTLRSTATERHAPQCRQPEAGSRAHRERGLPVITCVAIGYGL